MCSAEHWDTRTLDEKIDKQLYLQTALSRKPEEVIKKELEDSSQNKVSEIVPNELAQLPENEFVPNGLAQIPSVLLATGWSNHQLIMGKCKSDEQRLFYMLYAGVRQLSRLTGVSFGVVQKLTK